MTDVKLLRLTTGEDIVAEVTNQEYADNVKTVTTIKKPFVLIPMAQNPSASQESKLYFSPFIPFAENEEFDIKEENIITVNEPKKDIRGNIARIYLYMSETYGVPLSESEIKQYSKWNRSDPADKDERDRNT